MDIVKMAIELNKMYKVDRNTYPSSLTLHDAKQFRDCMERYSKRIVEHEDNKDVVKSAEALSEMLLMVLCYIDRKGMEKTIESTCNMCYDDLRRYLIRRDIEQEQDDFLFITEGQHEKTKIEPIRRPYDEIEKLFTRQAEARKKEKKRRAEIEAIKYKPKTDNLL